jgi:hypothetical protein
MQQRRRCWFLLNPYGWVVLGMSIATAFLVQMPWVILVGILGYQTAVLADLLGGRSLGRTGAIRLAMAEQENRELRAEQARLLGAIRERDDKLAKLIGNLEAVPHAPGVQTGLSGTNDLPISTSTEEGSTSSPLEPNGEE